MEQRSNRKKAKEFVPAWAKEAVWYQIFPERFRNGDRKNDPVKKSLEGSWPHDHASPWRIHPWTSDWYKLQPYEKKNGKDVWFNIQRRRYGGDIQGIIDKLDYLQDLGITAVYLNPVFASPSSHKYDASTYHHIDPHFGPDPQGDKKIIAGETPGDPSTWKRTSADLLMLKLIKEIHRRHMRVIFDGVFNHMGMNSWAFKDAAARQKKSLYKDWFKIKSWDDRVKKTKFNYSGWNGVRELPEWKQDKNGITEGPKKYIFDITRRWMDPDGDGNPADGIDGWRLDVAFLVKHNFWKDWRKFVKGINPQAYLTAEIIDPVKVLKPFLQGDEFDAVMNYNFAFICAEYFIERRKISASKFDERLRQLREAFPAGVDYAQQNLFDSHDTNRIASHVVNRNLGSYRSWKKYFPLSKGSNHLYDTGKPGEEEIRIQKLMVIFQMTYPGAPMIYYGDEAGMWGANDPCCRKPMVWEDMDYEDEIYLPDQSKRSKPCKVEFSHDLFNYYRKLIHIRNSSAALRLGDFKTIMTDDKNDVFAFSRNYKGEQIIIVLNNSASGRYVELEVRGKTTYRDLLNGGKIKSSGKNISLNIEGKSGRILKKLK